MSSIAIIPARSGSKGLKDKNIKELCGMPLMAYSIKAAIESGIFDTIMVSTDSEYYAEVARDYGAQVPFLRSNHTSSDTASSWDAVEEVLVEYKRLNKDFDTFMLLQPTSPLRTKDNIIEAYNKMIEMDANAVVSVCEVDHSPLQCNILPDDCSLVDFIQEKTRELRRQDMPIYYRFNGAIYLSRVDYFMENHNIYREKSFAYIMDKCTSIDIDDEMDFCIASLLMRSMGKWVQ